MKCESISPQSCLTLQPHGCSPPGSSVHRILQARILEWVAIPFFRGIFLTQGLKTCVSCIAGRFFTIWTTREAPVDGYVCKITSVVSNFYDPMNCSPLGTSVHGILQARIVEQAAISSSRDLPHPGIEPISLASPALQAGSSSTEPPGKPCLNTLSHSFPHLENI